MRTTIKIERFTHGSVCSGIGGFDLAANWAGFENIFHCENNEFLRRILNFYFPKAKSYGDITETDFSEFDGKLFLFSAGFPCQPFSFAGERRGSEDHRYIWKYVLRGIKESRPPWVLLENVIGLGSMVFPPYETKMEKKTNLFGEDNFKTTYQKYILRQFLEDLECEGYNVEILEIPAVAVGANHIRHRIWIIAHSNSNERRFEQKQIEREQEKTSTSSVAKNGAVANSFSERYKKRVKYWAKLSKKNITSRIEFNRFPTQSPVFSGDDGISGKLDSITLSDWRNESNKAFGNAIVPEVAYRILMAIKSTY